MSENQYGYPNQEEQQSPDPTHVKAEDFYVVERRIIDAGLPVGMTLARLAREHPDGYRFTLPAHLRKHMRSIAATTNRANASDEDLEGDEGRLLIVKARLISERSNAPIDIGMEIDGMVPRTLNDHDRFAWTIDAGIGHKVTVNEEIFEADNICTKEAFARNQVYNMDTLKRGIVLDADPKNGLATMDTNNIGWALLMKNMALGKLHDVRDTIEALNEHIWNAPESEHGYVAKVPRAVAEDVYEAAKSKVGEMEKAYTNIHSWGITFKPANGQAWDDPSYLVSESNGFNQKSKNSEVNAELHRGLQTKAKLELIFVVDGDK